MSRDTFTRSTSFGLGTGYTWTPENSSFASASASTYHVDGSKLVIPADPLAGPYTKDTYIIDATLPTSGVMQFDIYYPTLSEYTGVSDWWPAVSFIINNGVHDFAISIEEAYSGSPEIYVASGPTGTGDTQTFSVTPDNWYTVKMQYVASGHVANYKFWQKGTPEPGWQLTSTYDLGDNTIGTGFAQSWINFWYSGSVESYFDNLVFESTLGYAELALDAFVAPPNLYFTADAVILGPTTETGSFTANATIKKTTSRTFTSNAAFVNRTFTANAVLGDPKRNRHHRIFDHEGSMMLSEIVLERTITGRYPALPTYPAGMPVVDVILDIVARLDALPGDGHFTADAYFMRTWTWYPGSTKPYAISAEAEIVT